MPPHAMTEPLDSVAMSIFLIEGSDQPGQGERLRRAIKGLPGVSFVEINHLLGTAKVRYDPRVLSLARIKNAI